MKCINCGKETSTFGKFCDNCGKVIVLCPGCDRLVSLEDDFCGNCGHDLSKAITKAKAEQEAKDKEDAEKKKMEELHEEMKEYASNVIINCEGNKFKAIKEFKDKYNVDTDYASKYINKAYNLIDSNFNNDEETKTLKPQFKESIEDILKRNNYERITAVKEVMNIYGYDVVTAKQKVDEEISSLKNLGQYVDPNGIKRTIIVSQSSRKKATSAIGRGLIGGAILGPIGLLAGASAKSKESTTFQVIYNNGRQETVTVSNNSWAFKEYCKYLDS